jgi:hypothetical protein
MAVKSNIKRWANEQHFVADRAEQIIAGVILNRAILLAPKDTGMLHTSGRIIKERGRSVVFGDNEVPYARIHELGGFTGRNYATKIEAKHYLKNAGDSVAKENIKKYVDMSR